MSTAAPDAGTGRSTRRSRNGDHVSVSRVAALGGMDLVKARFVTLSSHRHSHPEVEIGVVVSGRREVRCRNRQFVAPAGSIVIFRPGEIHAGAPLDEKGSRYRAFLIPWMGLGADAGWDIQAMSNGAEAWFKSPVIRDPALARALVKAHVALADRRPDGRTVTGLAGTLADLARRHRGTGTAGAVHSREPEPVARVRAYLEECYPSKIHLATLARMAGLSVYHLIRVFRAATGLPPYAYLEQIRVDRAAALLREGHPVSRVACVTGFADQSHLTRLFKRLVGVPPGEYRKAARLAS